MNVFSKWTASTNESARTDETVSAPTNLMAWPANGNSWINNDLTGSGDNKVNEGWDTNGNSQVLATAQEAGYSNQLQSSTKSATKKHNGVTWTYSNPSANTAVSSRDGNTTTDNSITITGSVNIYRSKNNNQSYQTVFRINNLIKLISKSYMLQTLINKISLIY